MTIKGNLVDILQQKIYPAEIIVAAGKIKSINKLSSAGEVGGGIFLLPGFIAAWLY